jgi:hypothetical protein
MSSLVMRMQPDEMAWPIYSAGWYRGCGTGCPCCPRKGRARAPSGLAGPPGMRFVEFSACRQRCLRQAILFASQRRRRGDPSGLIRLVSSCSVDGRPLRVFRVILTAPRSFSFYPNEQTFSGSVGMSERCPTADLHKRAGSGAAIRRCQYQYIREGQAGAIYEFMREFAALEPQPPELQKLFRTVHGNQAAMDGFGEYRSDFCRCSQKGTQCCCYC